MTNQNVKCFENQSKQVANEVSHKTAGTSAAQRIEYGKQMEGKDKPAKSFTPYSFIYENAKNAKIATRENAAALRSILERANALADELQTLISARASETVKEFAAAVVDSPLFVGQEAPAKRHSTRAMLNCEIAERELKNGTQVVRTINGEATKEIFSFNFDARHLYNHCIDSRKSAELLRQAYEAQKKAEEEAERFAAVRSELEAIAAAAGIPFAIVENLYKNGVTVEQIRASFAL